MSALYVECTDADGLKAYGPGLPAGNINIRTAESVNISGIHDGTAESVNIGIHAGGIVISATRGSDAISITFDDWSPAPRIVCPPPSLWEKKAMKAKAHKSYRVLEKMGSAPDPVNWLICEFAYGLCGPRPPPRTFWQKLQALFD